MDVRRVQRAERERECEQTLILGFLCSFRNHFSYFDEMVEVVYLMNSHLRKMTSALRKQCLKRKNKNIHFGSRFWFRPCLNVTNQPFRQQQSVLHQFCRFERDDLCRYPQ